MIKRKLYSDDHGSVIGAPSSFFTSAVSNQTKKHQAFKVMRALTIQSSLFFLRSVSYGFIAPTMGQQMSRTMEKEGIFLWNVL